MSRRHKMWANFCWIIFHVSHDVRWRNIGAAIVRGRDDNYVRWVKWMLELSINSALRCFIYYYDFAYEWPSTNVRCDIWNFCVLQMNVYALAVADKGHTYEGIFCESKSFSSPRLRFFQCFWWVCVIVWWRQRKYLLLLNAKTRAACIGTKYKTKKPIRK